tara:strand:- start:1323 stop:1745 length:423 start_codon:yes stop_codon:yes gene_type:complete
MTNGLDWRMWTPIISGSILSILCPIKAGQGVLLKHRPPSYVFGIVWSILYILTGYSWKTSRNERETDIMHGVLTVLLCLWIITFSCMGRKKIGLYVLSLVVATVICCMCLHGSKWSKIALTPLLAWTTFAMHLNYHILDS